MRTYQAGKDPGGSPGGESRAWVFDVLENPEHRRRLDALAGLDLKRRAGCEPCLHALVTDDWNHESLHHLGWCESCRNASLALGMNTSSKMAGYPYRRALVVALVAGVAIAAPLAGSRLLDDGNNGRGGVAQQVTQTTPGTNPSTTPGTNPSTTPTTTATTPGTTPATTSTATTPTTTEPATTNPVIKPVPRTRTTSRGHQALPKTT
jgi:hypothetical protein